MLLASGRVCPAIAIAALVCLGLAASAKADALKANACSRGLAPEAATIYRDTAPEVTPSTDLRTLLRTRVKALVLNGSVQRATAHSSAVAAYGCLTYLK